MANSLSQEEINFLRLAGLLIRIAPRAVRKKFDDEFHPVQLKQMLSENRREIYDLTYKKRVITQNQYDLLYPRGCSNVSSETFDVSLMVCLLRHFTDLDIHDGLPLAHIHTPEADVSRIKYYRNYIVHSECGKVTDTKFFEIWNCLVEAIRRLSSELKPDIDSLMVSPLTNVRDVKGFLHLKEELEKTNQRLNKIVQKAETIGIENLNFEDIRNRTLQKWRYKDKKYVPTSATTFILHSLKHNRGVIITGSPGCGKSVTAHHVALKLEKEGYDIIPCDEPSEILMYFTKEKIQVFVIDDVCGKFALNQHKSDSWEQYDSKLDMLTESCTLSGDNEENLVKSKIKFIITCRRIFMFTKHSQN
ncbi:unnamed protein product [Mytilus edulis]|uniref:DZIP3-like HEPN domain-containing protein n=1 Tax=Mytilus edulis TaxID=6550 RepID=A0A8S3TUB5_MYTED|nr:unnamed protein product [Mytilus edulis]